MIKKGPNDLTWSGISVINPVIFNSLNGRKGSFEIWDSVLKEQIKNKTQSKKIGLINFTPHFYEESLKKIATFKTDSINFSTFKITQTRKINLLLVGLTKEIGDGI